jgi:hypothetical protein
MVVVVRLSLHHSKMVATHMRNGPGWHGPKLACGGGSL